MTFEMKYDLLSESEKANLKKCINILIAQNYIVRDVYSQAKGVTSESAEYRFIDYHADLINEYFSIMGWALHIDRTYGVAHAFYQENDKNDQFSLSESMFLITMRLIYNEERDNLSTKREVKTSTREIIEKMMSTGAVKNKPNDTDTVQALRLARNHNVITKISGSWTDPKCSILIYPSILFLVSDSVVNKLLNRIKTARGHADENTEIA